MQKHTGARMIDNMAKVTATLYKEIAKRGKGKRSDKRAPSLTL